MSRRNPRGFTLIELMIVLAIVGILSSIAVPNFRSFQLRSKQAERSVMMASIRGAIDDVYVRDGRYPWDIGGGWSYLYLAYDNPDASPTSAKRPWRTVPLNTYDHWSRLSIVVQGNVYYSYWGYAYFQPGGTRLSDVRVTGDLDGDSVLNALEYTWLYDGTSLRPWYGGNHTCEYRCSYAWETNPNTF